MLVLYFENQNSSVLQFIIIPQSERLLHFKIVIQNHERAELVSINSICLFIHHIKYAPKVCSNEIVTCCRFSGRIFVRPTPFLGFSLISPPSPNILNARILLGFTIDVCIRTHTHRDRERENKQFDTQTV